MNPENLYATLSPKAYAALIDGLRSQAERERRVAIRVFGLAVLNWLRKALKNGRLISSPPSPSTATHAAAARCSHSAAPCP